MFDDVKTSPTNSASAGTPATNEGKATPAVGAPTNKEDNSNSGDVSQPLKGEPSPRLEKVLANSPDQEGQPSAQPAQSAAPPAGSGAGEDKEEKPKVEDIFSEVEKKEKPAAFQPKSVSSAPAETYTPPRRSGARKILFLFVLLLIFGGLGVGGWLGYGWLTAKVGLLNKLPWVKEKNQTGEEKKGTTTAEKNEEKQTKTEKKNPNQKESAGEKNIAVPSKPQPTLPKDTDQDGLTDEEEMNFGTDINSIDTDEDGLFDRDEVKVYKTDPLNPDTDGDGYPDGTEVKAGYNPNGAGRLYEIKK
jgi:hypothetical protein